jgi:sec-independent protein translocase protein TatA
MHCVAFIGNVGTGEWMVILFIGLLVFGRRLPDVARSLGKSVNEFKKGLRDFQDSANDVASDVNKIKNDVVNEVASQVNEATAADSAAGDSHGYQYGGETVTEAGTTRPEAAAETTQAPAATESTQAPSPTDQSPQNPGIENIEPMK